MNDHQIEIITHIENQIDMLQMIDAACTRHLAGNMHPEKRHEMALYRKKVRASMHRMYCSRKELLSSPVTGEE